MPTPRGRRDLLTLAGIVLAVYVIASIVAGQLLDRDMPHGLAGLVRSLLPWNWGG